MKRVLTEEVIQKIVDDPKYKDDTVAGKQGRRKVMWRAIYGEFVGTVMFFTPIFGCLANSIRNDWDPSFTNMTAALVSGLNLVMAIMCFSNISGAVFNPAISFSLWITKKLSNRKFIFYCIVQLLASIFAMFLIFCTFPRPHEVYKVCTVRPGPDTDSGRVFMTEFVATFILTYTAFTIAFEEADMQRKSTMSVQAIHDSDGLTLYSSAPTSKSGFAPFAIGFVVFSLSMFGGSSGISMNPARMFGPAIFSGHWESFYIYTLAEFAGAGAAGLIVVYGIQSTPNEELLKQAKRSSMATGLASSVSTVERPSLAMNSLDKPPSPTSSPLQSASQV